MDDDTYYSVESFINGVLQRHTTDTLEDATSAYEARVERAKLYLESYVRLVDIGAGRVLEKFEH